MKPERETQNYQLKKVDLTVFSYLLFYLKRNLKVFTTSKKKRPKSTLDLVLLV